LLRAAISPEACQHSNDLPRSVSLLRSETQPQTARQNRFQNRCGSVEIKKSSPSSEGGSSNVFRNALAASVSTFRRTMIATLKSGLRRLELDLAHPVAHLLDDDDPATSIQAAPMDVRMLFCQSSGNSSKHRNNPAQTARSNRFLAIQSLRQRARPRF